MYKLTLQTRHSKGFWVWHYVEMEARQAMYV